MLDTLIKSGYRWSDFDEMTEEDLYDLVDAQAKRKEAKREKIAKAKGEKPKSPEDNSLESFLKSSGILK